MLILINGLPHFSRIMADDLNEFDAANKYVFLNTYESKWSQILFLLLLPFCGAVISFNGVTDKSKSLDWVLRFKKKLIMQWQGTDVSIASIRQKNGKINRKYIDYSTHFISSSWFKDELIGVCDTSVYAPFSYVKEVGNDSNYKNVSIFSYIAKGREEFYGWKELIETATVHPELNIRIAGTDGEGLIFPKNVTCLGWISETDFQKELKKNAIFVRLTEHDGKSLSVAQALARGCEVIWTYEFDCCHTIQKETNSLNEKIDELVERIKNRNLLPNYENIEFTENNLQRKPVMSNYCSTLKKYI